MTTSRWTMDVTIEAPGEPGTDRPEGTRAEVRLADGCGNSFTGIGIANGDLHGLAVPQIRAELAIARALSDLTEELLAAVAADVHAALIGPAVPPPAATAKMGVYRQIGRGPALDRIGNTV